jgi:hypothetical protein
VVAIAFTRTRSPCDPTLLTRERFMRLREVLAVALSSLDAIILVHHANDLAGLLVELNACDLNLSFARTSEIAKHFLDHLKFDLLGMWAFLVRRNDVAATAAC